MEVLSLATEQFRNLSDAEIAFGPRINVLFGDNAQGKTNLIEAIWLFSGAKSFRGSKDNEMIAFGRRNNLIDASLSGQSKRADCKDTIRRKR